MASISQALQEISHQLQAVSESPRLDAELLLAKVCQCERSYLYAHSEKVLTRTETSQLQEFIQQRLRGVPIAYLLGEQEFWSLRLFVDEHVLIPRADTEILVETVLKTLNQETATVLDAGCGSGAIAIALASERPAWTLLANDISPEALKTAQHNGQYHQLNINWLQMNWLDAIASNSLDAIVSNPPYIAGNDPHLTSLNHEPQRALISEKEGYYDIQCLIKSAKRALKQNGWIFLEHGYQQVEKVQQFMLEEGFIHIGQTRDLQNWVRVSFACWSGKSGSK